MPPHDCALRDTDWIWPQSEPREASSKFASMTIARANQAAFFGGSHQNISRTEVAVAGWLSGKALAC
jgi:hypothetical protein